MSDFDKPEFVRRLKSADASTAAAAFDDVFDEMFGRLCDYLRHEHGIDHPEDLAVVSLYKVHQGLRGFRNESKLTTWIFQIARNTAHDFFRRQLRSVGNKSEPRDALNAPNRITLDDPTFDKRFAMSQPDLSVFEDPIRREEVTDKHRRNRHIFLSLPKLSRRILLASIYLTDKQIAERLSASEGKEIPLSTIRSWRRRAKKQLEELRSADKEGE